MKNSILEREKQSKLPDGWEMKKLGEVCKIVNGGTPKSKIKEYWGGNINWITPKNLGKLSSKYVSDTARKITKLGLAKSSAKLLPPNSVILSTRAPIGHLAINKTSMSTNQGCRGLIPQKNLDNHYLFYFLKSNIVLLNELGTGTTFKELSAKNLFGVQIPIPPLHEQKAIVALLDKAFAKIEQAKANIEQNIINAKELFQSKLNEIFSQKGEGWEERKLGELSLVKSGGTPSRARKEYWDEGHIPWYSSGELNDTFTTEPERHITNEGLENSNAKLFPKGSLLIGMYDTAALKMSIIDRDATFNQAIVGVEPRENLNLIFVLNAINAQKKDILKLRRGVRQKNLNLSKIKAIKIPIPIISMQNSKVEKLTALNTKIRKMEAKYNLKLLLLNELKKSLLQKAFSGKLTLENVALSIEVTDKNC